MGQMEAPSSWVGDRELVCLRNTDAEPEKGIRSYRAIALTSVMPKWYASCILIRLEKEIERENWKNLHVGGIEGISCKHFQVMMTHLLQKHWEWHEDRRPMMRHGSVIRPTMCWANMDIKTAFDVPRPKHIARIMEDHNVIGLIIAVLFEQDGRISKPCSSVWRENSHSPDAFAKVASKPFDYGRKWPCSSWQKWKRNRWAKEWASFWIWRGRKLTRYAWADNHLVMSHLEPIVKDLIQEAERWDLDPKSVSKCLPFRGQDEICN